MALKVADRVKETATGTSGDMALAGAVSGFVAFDADATFDGNTTYYVIEDADGTKWEVGLGTLSADSTTLARTTILATQVSFTDTTRQTFSGGTHTVFATYPAGKAVYKDATGKVGIGTESPSYALDVYGHDAWVQASGVIVGASGIVLDSDSSAIKFGDDQEITLTHVSDSGLTLKHDASGDDKPLLLTLATGETSIVADEVLAKIAFQAPNESQGGDGASIAAAIQAVAEGTFGGSANKTRIEFMTGASEAATTKAVITNAGHVGIGTTAPGHKLDVFGHDAWVQASGVRVGPSGVVVEGSSGSGISVKAQGTFGDYTLILPSGNGTNGQVLTTDSVQSYWSTAGGGVSGDTFATDLKIGRDADNLIDFATTDNKIIFRANGNDEVELVENALSPVISDGVALGTGSLMWSDLFIANGGVVNFNNGDATLTHESNKIVASGCELVVNRPGRSLATFRRTDDGDASIEVDASFHDADNDAQLRMLSGTDGDCSIFFGDTADNNIGLITYAHQTNALTIKTNATAAIVIDSNGTLATKGIIRNVTTKVDTDYTVLATDHIILVDTTNGDRDIDLPVAAPANIGQEYTIKKIDSGTGVVNITPITTGGYGPDDIDEYDLKYVLYVQHDSVTFVCGPGDATAADEQWWITAERKQAHAGIMQQRTIVADDYGQNIAASSVENEVAWDTIVKERPPGLANLSTERFDIARAGLYNVCAHVWYDNAVDTGERQRLFIYKNGTQARETISSVAHSENMYVYLHLNTVMNLATDDYIELWTSQSHSTPLRLNLTDGTGGAVRYPTFTIEEIL